MDNSLQRVHDAAPIAAAGAESSRPLPGDALVPDAKSQVTRGITIDAVPGAIWPWLASMVPAAGPAGAYTVVVSDEPRALVFGALYDAEAQRYLPFPGSRPAQFWDATWALVLEPIDERRTRLVVRARVAFTADAVRWTAVWMHPFHDFMAAEELRRVKRCAEGHPAGSHDTLREVGDAGIGALGILFDLMTPFLRAARSRWGLDAETAGRRYPGDDLVPTPTWGWTHGVTIEAPAAEVWPWIAQVGEDKAGFYSYEWLERLVGLHVHNADRVHPEWTQLQVGDPLVFHPAAPPLRIVTAAPGAFMIAATAPTDDTLAASWLFLIEPLGEDRCRFISRYRCASAGGVSERLAHGPALMEPVSFMMDRRMLLGIKERAERAHAARSSSPPASRGR